VPRHRRINITLPEETIRLIDRVARKGDRSFLISEAVQRYVKAVGKARLRRLLKEGALRHAGRDLSLAEDWGRLDADEEPWREDRG
jgi:CopG family transcriptional regulator/antitoxin EndoAI